MKALFAIAKLTLRNAVRSHVFQLLLLFLILCVALVPTTVGGSTAIDFIRVSLLYSLSGVGTILSLSALWVGCHVMSADIDSYQLHMVVSKPVSRVTIWLGKFSGVLILHLVLMILAAAAIYGVVVWRFRNGDFAAEERTRIRNEVLVGRRVYLPERRDYLTLANRMKDEKIRQQIADGKRRRPSGRLPRLGRGETIPGGERHHAGHFEFHRLHHAGRGEEHHPHPRLRTGPLGERLPRHPAQTGHRRFEVTGAHP